MSNHIEDQLRSVLGARANEIPKEAVSRLHSHHYRPRTQALRTRLVIGGGGFVSVSAAATITLLTFGPGVQNAFASWTSSPTTPAVGQVPAAESACLQSLLAVATRADTSDESTSFVTDASGWQPVVEDVRGDFTDIVYQGANGAEHNEAACLSGGSGWPSGPQVLISDENGMSISGSNGGTLAHASAQSSLASPTSIPSSNSVNSPSSFWNSSSNDVVAFAQVGSDVSGVTLTLSNGDTIVATVSNGFYAAWWPSNASISSIAITTAQDGSGDISSS
jgi:hypothetical protein